MAAALATGVKLAGRCQPEIAAGCQRELPAHSRESGACRADCLAGRSSSVEPGRGGCRQSGYTDRAAALSGKAARGRRRWPAAASRLLVKAVGALHETTTVALSREDFADEQDYLKAGGTELEHVQLQASKPVADCPKIADKLPALGRDANVDLVIVGCGPAGLCLAAESAKLGLSVGLIGPDSPFVNNYGVWVDEFQAIGLEDCLEQTWRDTAIYIDHDEPTLVGRPYGRVGRHLLLQKLLQRCEEAGVLYLDSQVEEITEPSPHRNTVHCQNGWKIQSRLVTVAAGAASGKFLTYQAAGRGVGVQTAYGMEVEVENYACDPSLMVFMDYRTAGLPGSEGDASEGLFRDAPTFLYAMPVTSTRIFFEASASEETCLARRPAMPFELLKARLHKRLQALKVRVKKVHEEEWSYIPVGGAIPDTKQRHLGYGAAASMVHPATGYSIARSLTEAPHYAAAIAKALQPEKGALHSSELMPQSHNAALQAWDALWSQERRRQRAFMLFGLELLLQLDLSDTRIFFHTFFRLPERLWKGFLSTNLSSMDLMWFAFMTFLVAPNSLRFRLVKHLASDPSGAGLIRTYLGLESSENRHLMSVKATEALAATGLLALLPSAFHLHA
eukprot:SM000133S26800  [mRNA]  locus=s133:113277:117083:- [translate_table: standard]